MPRLDGEQLSRMKKRDVVIGYDNLTNRAGKAS